MARKAQERVVKVDDHTYTYAQHTIRFSRPPGGGAGWILEVSGPRVNTSMEMHGQRDALALQAATAIQLAAASPFIRVGKRMVKV